MNQTIDLGTLSQDLYEWLRENHSEPISAIAQNALGMNYLAFQRRMTANKMKLLEMAKLLKYLSFESRIEIVALSQDDVIKASQKDTNELLQAKNDIIDLLRENGRLKIENQELRLEIGELKKE